MAAKKTIEIATKVNAAMLRRDKIFDIFILI